MFFRLVRRGGLHARRVSLRWLFLGDRLTAAVTPIGDPAAWRGTQRDPQTR